VKLKELKKVKSETQQACSRGGEDRAALDTQRSATKHSKEKDMIFITKKEILFLTFLPPFLFVLLSPLNSFSNDIIKGHEQFSKGNYNDAILHYVKKLDVKDEEGGLSYRIGICHMMIGNQHEASKYFKRAKGINQNISKNKTFMIPSEGMAPTLLIGDHVIVDNEFFGFSSIKRYHVVVLENPKKKDDLFIKRIIGLPGEKIQIKNNSIYIDDKVVEDNYGSFDKPSYKKAIPIKDYGPVTIPKRKYFALGDNRYNSFDSRHFGLVPEYSIFGKVLIVYASFDLSKDPPTMRDGRTGLTVD
jgi:signal peptidase I